jgi:peroxisomal 2,4-dienoyl-CoA reductase
VGRDVERTKKVAQDIMLVRLGARVLGLGAVDVRSFDSLESAVDRCVKELGAVDYVMYVSQDYFHRRLLIFDLTSAGAAGNFLASINQISVNAFKSVMEIDIQGSYNTLKATLPHLIRSAEKHRVDSKTRMDSNPPGLLFTDFLAAVQPSPLGTVGRILFVSATLHYTGTPFQGHVAVAKAGIDALSHTVALEFGPLGITSNVIAPGPIASTEVSCPAAMLDTGY